MFYKADVKKFIDFIVADVELLKLLECLNTLNVFKFASTEVEYSNISKWCSDITETWDDWVVQF